MASGGDTAGGGTPSRRVYVIGIGAGSPDHVTQQAASAIGEVDVVLVADKGGSADDLLAARRAILDRFADPARPPQLLILPDPDRGADASRGTAAYGEAVRSWHGARAEAWATAIDDLPGDAVVGFLVWGDPAFYDSTIRIVDAIAERIPLQVTVIPGISAFQALAAAHGVVLHDIGEPVHITTGRRLAKEWRADLGTVVVMLDGHLACRDLVATTPDLVLRWGAYVGMPHQQLRAGRLADIIDDVVELRAELRQQYGWVMDVYTLSSH